MTGQTGDYNKCTFLHEPERPAMDLFVMHYPFNYDYAKKKGSVN